MCSLKIPPHEKPCLSFAPLEVPPASNTRARCGLLTLPGAQVRTPVFMPVGTRATVKAMSAEDLEHLGYRLILGNTYHLEMRPSAALIAEMGGLPAFSAWNGAMLTDSGGFQVFSLKTLRRISDNGVQFQSHIDGSLHEFTSESVMKIQRDLAADIIMAWDECAPHPSPAEYIEAAMNRTHNWLDRCIVEYDKAHRRATNGMPQALFGIVQGGTVKELRLQSIAYLGAKDLPGYAVGGLAVGETEEERCQSIDWSLQNLPVDRPKYLMGVGTPVDILNAIDRGIDMFDCVLPTRNARNGQIITSQGPINIRNAAFQNNIAALDPSCSCLVCSRYSRAYVHHLFRMNEMLGPRLATFHNLAFYANLLEGARQSIMAGTFAAFKHDFLSNYLSEGQGVSKDE